MTFMAGALTTAFTGCKDDHFDVNPDVVGTHTIWQNIQNNPDLSQYADILQSVYYSPTEEKTSSETYADFLNGDQTLTVWAPLNNKFDYAYYKGLLNTGNRDSIYKVEKELIRNNMTRFSHVLNGQDSVKLDLFNEKAAWLNFNQATLQGRKITTPNIAASNGVLHIIETPVAYQPNLYEYMASRPDLDSLNRFIKGFQKLEFNESASTQGPTINGEVTWVDSITYVSNDYTRLYMDAYLNREDSNYVMIMPTNTAWDAILAKTKKFYTFKQEYVQTIHTQTELGNDTTYEAKNTFSQAELDSLNNLYSKNAICQDLVFNANWQYEGIPITSIQDIRNLDARNDSLRSTARTKFKKAGTLDETNKGDLSVEVNSFAEMFGNAEPVETSNGYAYIVNEWKLPSEVYAPVIDRSAVNSLEYSDNNCNASELSSTIEYPSFVVDEEGTTVRIDSIYKYNYLRMQAKTNNTHPGAYFRIPGVLSATYDIFVVIGYNRQDMKPNKFRAWLAYDRETDRVNIERPNSTAKNNDAILKNPNEDAVDAKGASIYNGNFFVNREIWLNNKNGKLNAELTDTICLARDFTFPICYQGLADAYPTLFLQSSFTSGEKDIYSRNIWVNAIILRPKDN